METVDSLSSVNTTGSFLNSFRHMDSPKRMEEMLDLPLGNEKKESHGRLSTRLVLRLVAL